MKLRTPIAVLTFAVLSAWVSAQPVTLTAADQLKFWKSNRQLLEEMLDEGIQLAGSNTNLDRAARCKLAADRLTRELRNAADREDIDRIAEIGDHFDSLMMQGFVPNLETATESIPPGSPDYAKLLSIHRDAAKSLDTAKGILPTDGKFSKVARVQTTRAKLDAVAKAIGQPKDQ